MMGIQSESALSSPGDSVIVVMEANRNKGSVDALVWAIKHVVHPKDTVVVLGLLSEVVKRPSGSCFPFQMGIGFSGIWVRQEFYGPGELSPKELEEEIEKKRDEYQCILQPFNRHCKKNKVKLEAKLAVGYDPRKITVEEAHRLNPRWIILDSHLRKDKVYIYGHVACNVAVMKTKGVATLMPSKGILSEHIQTDCEEINDVFLTENEPDGHQDECHNPPQDTKFMLPTPTPQSPCWYPLSWKAGFPRAFLFSELEEMTNGFANESVVMVREHWIIYEAIYQETPILIRCFSGNHEQVPVSGLWPPLIKDVLCLNFFGVGTAISLSLIRGYRPVLPLGNQVHKRWCIALEIGAGVRYLHEECADGPIVDLSLSTSCNIVLCHGSSALLNIGERAKWFKDGNKDSPAKSQNIEKEECLFADVSAYGTVLVELISGKSARCFQEQGKEDQSLINWAVPLLENGSLSELMDPRLIDSSDSAMVDRMARAALLCLKNYSTISEVLAVVRGDEFAITIQT